MEQREGQMWPERMQAFEQLLHENSQAIDKHDSELDRLRVDIAALRYIVKGHERQFQAILDRLHTMKVTDEKVERLEREVGELHDLVAHVARFLPPKPKEESTNE